MLAWHKDGPVLIEDDDLFIDKEPQLRYNPFAYFQMFHKSSGSTSNIEEFRLLILKNFDLKKQNL